MRSNFNVSIITVCFNAESTIEETFLSVFSQKFKNFEYIVKDGSSRDGTMSIVSKYKKRIATIISSKDKGLYDAMNIAVKKAKGEYICFLNADDIFKDAKVLQNISKYLDGKNDLVFGDVEFSYPSEKKKVRISRIASINELKKGNMPPHQASFVRRELLLKNPFNTKYRSSADFDFFCRILQKGIITKKVPLIVAVMRMGGVSAGSVSYRETEQIIKKYFGFVPFVSIKAKHCTFNAAKSIFHILGLKVHKG
ncbi:MAG: glycosyltransferase family 2 protein [archaeon]